MNEEMDMKKFVSLANKFGQRKEPFFFLIDFEKRKPVLLPMDECGRQEVFFDFQGIRNFIRDAESVGQFKFSTSPILFEEYNEAFEKVQRAIKFGDSYLANLCFPTEVKTDLSLDQIFYCTHAKYKLRFKDEFVVFSPEPFVTIDQNIIYTYPMKGTISANVPGAKEKILGNKKEAAEHATIVDFLRNDLNIISEKVRVRDYRYIEKLLSRQRSLYQVSSKISGELGENFYVCIGDILDHLTPAGSISGAPKKRTIEIIQEAERRDRGYFTGVFGYFDVDELGNCSLQSAVSIRYIEEKDGKMQFWSGGGITHMSEAKEEYEELISKVYVPIY